jgi:hypothetical protein
MTLAPRGIVAAAVASLFALHLTHDHDVDGSSLIALTFIVIVGTIIVYAIAAPIAARALGVSTSNPQGVMLVGIERWSRELATALQETGVKTLMLDGNWAAVRRARMDGLEAEARNVLSEHLADEVDVDGIGHALMLTPNDHTNSLASIHLAEVFGRANVYQLTADQGDLRRSGQKAPSHLRGRRLCNREATYSTVLRMIGEGAKIRRTSITDEFGMDSYRKRYSDVAMPLLIVRPDGRVAVFAADQTPRVAPGDTLIGLVPPDDATSAARPESDAQADASTQASQ